MKMTFAACASPGKAFAIVEVAQVAAKPHERRTPTWAKTPSFLRETCAALHAKATVPDAPTVSIARPPLPTA